MVEAEYLQRKGKALVALFVDSRMCYRQRDARQGEEYARDKHSHDDKDNGHGAVHVEDRQVFRHHNGKEIKQQHEAPHEEQKETDGVHCLTAHHI